MYILDAVHPIHVVSNHVATEAYQQNWQNV